jgi:hypothetical protein
MSWNDYEIRLKIAGKKDEKFGDPSYHSNEKKKAKTRTKLQRDIDKFLLHGGVITHLPGFGVQGSPGGLSCS